MKKIKTKRVRMWGGFVEGILMGTKEFDYANYQTSALMKSIYIYKKDARKRFQDVRPVIIEYRVGKK